MSLVRLTHGSFHHTAVLPNPTKHDFCFQAVPDVLFMWPLTLLLPVLIS